MNNVNTTQRNKLDSTAKAMAGKPSVLVVDACVIRNAMGEDNDHIVKNASISAANTIANSFSSLLKNKGHKLTEVTRPMICGGIDLSAEVKIADDVGQPSKPATQELLLLDNFFSGDALAEVKQLLDTASKPQDGTSPKGDGYPVALTISQETLEKIRETAGTDKLWLLRMTGTDVSGGLAVTQGIVSTVLSALLTGGASAFTSMSADGFAYSVAAIDLSKGRILWSKHLGGQQGDPASSKTFSPEWAKSVLAPLYSL